MTGGAHARRGAGVPGGAGASRARSRSCTTSSPSSTCSSSTTDHETRTAKVAADAATSRWRACRSTSGSARRCARACATRSTEGYGRVVVVDADGQHDPATIEALLDALDAGADMVIGSRFADPRDRARSRSGRMRRRAMKLLHRVVRWQTGQSFTDTTSGFRAFDAPVVAMLARDYPVEYLADTVEVLLMVSRAGYRVVEVPVAMRTRAGGQPSARQLQLVVQLPAAHDRNHGIGLAPAHRPTEGAAMTTPRPSLADRRDRASASPTSSGSSASTSCARSTRCCGSASASCSCRSPSSRACSTRSPAGSACSTRRRRSLFLAVGFLFFVVVHFSWELSRLESRVRTLAEEIALLRAEGGPAASVSADEHRRRLKTRRRAKWRRRRSG